MNKEFKICSKCKKEKPLSEFGDNIKNKDGKKCRCKKCKNTDSKIYRKTKIGYKEKFKQYMKNRRENNPHIAEKENKQAKLYRKNNLEKVKCSQKKWRDKNKNHLQAYNKKDYIKNKNYYKVKNKESVNNLHASYIAYIFKIPVKELQKYTNLIELKQNQLKLYRECRNQKVKIKNYV